MSTSTSWTTGPTPCQDDCYLIAADGWKAETYRVIETTKGKDGKPGKREGQGLGL